MFKKILVPVDLTERNWRAIEQACELTAPGTGQLLLVHVIETIEDSPLEEFEAFYRRLEDKAQARLADWVHKIGARGHHAERLVVYGRRSEQIVRVAEAEGADLIIVSSHRVEPDRPGGGWGTISYQVAVFAACPVLLIK